MPIPFTGTMVATKTGITPLSQSKRKKTYTKKYRVSPELAPGIQILDLEKEYLNQWFKEREVTDGASFYSQERGLAFMDGLNSSLSTLWTNSIESAINHE